MNRMVSRRLLGVIDSWWGVALTGVLVTVILYQKWQLMHPPHIQRIAPLAIGQKIPALAIHDLVDTPVALNWSTSKMATVVYVFHPPCQWCKRNLESVRMVVDHARNYRFIGLSLHAEGLKEYVNTFKPPFPVYYASTADVTQTLKLGATPETIVISPDGTVEKVWLGAYSGKTKQAIEALFGVELPDLKVPVPGA